MIAKSYSSQRVRADVRLIDRRIHSDSFRPLDAIHVTEAVLRDLDADALPSVTVDRAWSRWVFSFVAHVLEIVAVRR